MLNESIDRIVKENDNIPAENTSLLYDIEAEKLKIATPFQNKHVSELKQYVNNGNVTPEREFTIKTQNVTPMPNYKNMDTPQRNLELDKFGLKPLKKGKSKHLT